VYIETSAAVFNYFKTMKKYRVPPPSAASNPILHPQSFLSLSNLYNCWCIFSSVSYSPKQKMTLYITWSHYSLQFSDY